MAEKQTIILTGGAGFIGSHTYIELINNYNVIIIDNFINSNKKVIDKLKLLTNTESSDIIIYQTDLLNKSKLDSIFNIHKPYAVIHFAGFKAVGESVEKPLYYYQNNLISTLNLLEIMKKYNCYNLIFSSSCTVYGNQKSPLSEDLEIGRGITNPYGQTKFMIERILNDICISNDKWKIISLRYFNPVGAHISGLIGEDPNDIPNNLMPFILKVAINHNTTYNLGTNYNILNIFGNNYETRDGTCIRDFIHVVDLAKGHKKALEKIDKLSGYNIYNLGTGNGTTVLEMVNIFIKVNNVKLPYKFTDKRQGDLQETYCYPNKAEKELGWKTQKTLEDICKDSWKFQLNNPNGIE
jgi:UDP-glucose 4-epimerase